MFAYGMKEVDAWLFDLGNVVIGIDFDLALASWAAVAGKNLDDLRNRFHFDTSYERHERGQIEAEKFFDSLRSMLDIDLTNDQFAAGWNAIYTGPIAAVIDLIPSLANSRSLYAFTNTNVTHHLAWSTIYRQELQPFERIFLSCEMGVRKPEAAAFTTVARQIDVPLERILFFDDTEENVVGARAVGMQSVWVRSPADVIDAVTPYLQAGQR